MESALGKAVSDILDACERCAAVLRWAAERSRQPELRALFARRAEEYQRANVELQGLLWTLGVADGNTARDSLTAPTASIGEASDLALLEGCERLEMAALECHGRALRAAPPPELRCSIEFQRAAADASLGCVRAIVHALVARQCEDLRRNHAHVLGLREQARKRIGLLPLAPPGRRPG